MKIKLFLIVLIAASFLNVFGYVHVFSYQDFTDYEVESRITESVIPSNDDGTHGSNDRWGPNNEKTWPDVPGDTNIYIDSALPPEIQERDGRKVILMQGDEDCNSIIGLQKVPNPTGNYLMVSYEMYITEETDRIVLFSNTKPDNTQRVFIVYEDGQIKVKQKIGRYNEKIIFSKSYNLYNRWFKLSLRAYSNELRLTIGTRRFFTGEFRQRFDTFPYYYVGNWMDDYDLSNMKVYIDKFIVSHGR